MVDLDDLNGAESGTVYLVGAGPGDPDLLTLRTFEILRTADIVFFDNLTSEEVLGCINPAAERVYVGKKRAEHIHSQAEINGMLVRAARAGQAVVRLKGGDPFVFGRGGEEAQSLFRAHIPFEVVPGITSALGAAAYGGMPLTHRQCTQAVTMLTGHDVERIDWPAMASGQTLVVFMGLLSFAEIARRLIDAGMDPSTPAAALRWVTRGDQSTVSGTVCDLAERIQSTGMRPPALVIIGEIVSLRPEIDWFGELPLRGQSIVVTRAESQALGLCRRLRRLGARVISVPTIAFEPPTDWGPADEAIRKLREFDWAIFTSVNGVDRFVARLLASGRDLRDLPGRIGAIGPATAERVRSLHLRVDLQPDEFVAEALVRAFQRRQMRGASVLLPRAEEARPVLPRELEDLGARVVVAPVYRTVLPDSSRELAGRAWKVAERPDWVTVTSSSTVRNLAALVGTAGLAGTRLASIGPITSATARNLGLEVTAEATSYTAKGLVAALCAHAKKGSADVST